jgi:hypothetical protein
MSFAPCTSPEGIMASSTSLAPTPSMRSSRIWLGRVIRVTPPASPPAAVAMMARARLGTPRSGVMPSATTRA